MLISSFSSANNINQILAFEKRYSIVLPDDYKDFIKKYNGGYTLETYVPKCRSNIVVLFGIDLIEKEYDLNRIFEIKGLAYELLEQDLLVIGENEWGDYFSIVIDRKSNDYGKIIFKYHDKKKTVIVADSFFEFTKACKSKRLKKPWTIEERCERVKKAGNEDKINDYILKTWQDEIDFYEKIKQEELILY